MVQLEVLLLTFAFHAYARTEQEIKWSLVWHWEWFRSGESPMIKCVSLNLPCNVVTSNFFARITKFQVCSLGKYCGPSFIEGKKLCTAYWISSLHETHFCHQNYMSRTKSNHYINYCIHVTTLYTFNFCPFFGVRKYYEILTEYIKCQCVSCTDPRCFNCSSR